MGGENADFFPGSLGPRDHLVPKIGLLFRMSRFTPFCVNFLLDYENQVSQCYVRLFTLDLVNLGSLPTSIHSIVSSSTQIYFF